MAAAAHDNHTAEDNRCQPVLALDATGLMVHGMANDHAMQYASC
jgi:hypothetical protein